MLWGAIAKLGGEGKKQNEEDKPSRKELIEKDLDEWGNVDAADD